MLAGGMLPYVEVAVGLPVQGTYHYAVPEGLGPSARVGARVLVPFGARGVTGVIVRQSDKVPADVEVRRLSQVLEDLPPLDARLVELCLWIADYYEAPPGEVLRAALPAGTAVAAAARWVVTDAGRAALGGAGEGGALSRAARRVLAAIADGRPSARGSEAARDSLVAAGLLAR